MAQEHKFSENSISQGKRRVWLGLSSIVMICNNLLDGIHGLWLGFALKTWILWKTVKWYGLCETLGLKWNNSELDEPMNMWWMYVFVYLWNINIVELLNQLNLICSIYVDWLHLIVNYKLTPSGRLVDHLPYPYGWVDGVHEQLCFGELLEDSLKLPRLSLFRSLVVDSD